MRYPDLLAGGVALAAALQQYHRAENTIVLAIVRGGVTMALEVARALELPIDLVLLRPMWQRLPDGPVCAARVAGALALHEELRAMQGHPAQTIQEIFLADALKALEERDRLCRGSRPSPRVAGQTVLLVDNGLRTGGTMRSAIEAARTFAPARVIAATPTGSSEAVALIEPLADELICLSSPAPFGHVGMWYQRFDVGSEHQIRERMDEFQSLTSA